MDPSTTSIGVRSRNREQSVEWETDPSFDLSGSDLRSMMEELTAFAVEFVDRLGASRTATEGYAGEVADRFVEAEPAPASLRELLAALEDASAVGFNPLHPGFLGYVPPTGLPISAIADFVAAILGRYVGMHRPSPALAQIELTALRWIADRLGLPAAAARRVHVRWFAGELHGDGDRTPCRARPSRPAGPHVRDRSDPPLGGRRRPA